MKNKSFAIFILTHGGNKSYVPEVLRKLRTMRLFINVYPVTDADIDKMLATTWSDPEDALLANLALKMHADAIITGGSEAGINPVSIGAFANCKALTKSEDPKYASLPFNKNRAGFVIAEGSGIVLLEEYEHAKQRGAKIYAELCGYGNSCDAYHSTAPRPDGTTQSLAIKQALDEAKFKPGETIYINAHGTGTPMNDSGETKAIKIAMGEEEAHKALISSTKSEMGHALGAAGAIELIISVMAMNNGIIPPTIGLDEPDPECDLNYTPNVPVKANIDIAISNSLGFGGHNACLAIRKVK